MHVPLFPVVKWSLEDKESDLLFDALKNALEVLDHHFANYSLVKFGYTQKAVTTFWNLETSETDIGYTDSDDELIIALENPTIAS